jgi:hypothetical protein
MWSIILYLLLICRLLWSQQYKKLPVSNPNNTWCSTLVTDKLADENIKTEEETIVRAAVVEPTSLEVERQLRQRAKPSAMCVITSHSFSPSTTSIYSLTFSFSATISLLPLSFGSL